jgi:hypothetical protein
LNTITFGILLSTRAAVRHQPNQTLTPELDLLRFGFKPYPRSSASPSALDLDSKKTLNWTRIKSDASHTRMNQNLKVIWFSCSRTALLMGALVIKWNLERTRFEFIRLYPKLSAFY